MKAFSETRDNTMIVSGTPLHANAVVESCWIISLFLVAEYWNQSKETFLQVMNSPIACPLPVESEHDSGEGR